MADLPDYYTQAQLALAEVKYIDGGLDAAKATTPDLKQVYIATDTNKLYMCFTAGVWTNVTGLFLLLAGGTMTGAIAMGANKITGLADPAADQDAATRAYVLAQKVLCLLLTGGTMSGDIAMGNNIVSGMKAPTTDGDAARKKYVDDLVALYLLLAGGTMSGNIAMGGNKVTGLGAPVAANDAVRKAYADLFTLLATFNNHSARHEDTGADEISVAGLAGLLADDQHVLDAEALAAAWANIDEKSFHNLLTNGDFEVGDPPDNWTLVGAAATVARSAVQVKIGTYSALLTRNGSDCYILQDVLDIAYAGRLVTIGGWVRATVANTARLWISDNINPIQSSAYHTGGGNWEWLTVTITADAAAVSIRGFCAISNDDTAAYFDGVILVEGDSCPAFSPKLTALTTFNDHHARHEAGGADALANPIAIAAMANLTNTKIWQGDAGNRPVEVAMPPAIPSGIIVMWHGLIANIPAGWVLCDGTNDTPDLRERFVEGAADGVDPGATGGSTSKSHASHIHTMPTHVHEVGTLARSDGVGGAIYCLPNANPDTGATDPGDTNGTTVSAHSDIRPKYYDIAFIMKT